MSRKLIVGLGNPGRGYKHTRHNIGYRVAEGIAAEFAASFSRKIVSAQVARVGKEGEEIVIAKPTTFMNRSGEVVKELMERYTIPQTKDLLVILDDVNLPVGRFRFREKGSSGGHRGLESIIETLGTRAFQRLRIGVGLPRERTTSLEDYVLESFTREEEKELPRLLKRAVEASLLWVEKGAQTVMNTFNG